MEQTFEQLKPDRKVKAIASCVLGFISIIPIFNYILMLNEVKSFFRSGYLLYPSIPFLNLLGPFLFPILGIIGLILGITGLKSSKRIFAILGISFSIPGIISAAFLFLILHFQ
jgi:hypothetical protein